MSEMINPGREIGRGGHYSPAVRAGDFVFVSGQTPRNAERIVIGASIEEQTIATLENVRLVLAAAGCGLEHVVRVGVHLADLRDAPRFNAIYADHFSAFLPARTTVGSELNGVLVEVDVVAYISPAREVSP